MLFRILIFATIISFGSLNTSAQILVTLSASADNTMFQENAQASNGAGINIFVGRTYGAIGTQARRGLIRFDLSTLPPNAVVTTANLSLATLRSANNTTVGHTINLHRCMKNWGEGASSTLGSGTANNATTNDATWTFNLFNTSSWTTAGGDFLATASSSATAALNDYVVFGNLASDLNYWLANPSQNFGWIMIGQEDTPGSAKGLGSKENTLYPPQLTITYVICPSSLSVNGTLSNPIYKAAETINITNGTVSSGTTTVFEAGKSITVLPNSVFQKGAVVIVEPKGCL